MAWLNYHHLFYFYKIADLGSVSKAAEELYVGQSSLSIQLKELEERLGQLFERRSRTLVLNERGKIVYKYAKEIFSRGDELLGVLERGQLAMRRELIIGVQEGVPKAVTAHSLIKIQRKTKANIRVVEGEAPFLLDQLQDSRMDIVILDHELSHRDGAIIYLYLGKEAVSFWATDKFLKLRQDYPRSMSGVPLVLPSSSHPLRQTVEKFFVHYNLDMNLLIEAPDTGLVKELGAEGIGVVALGEETVRGWKKTGRLHKIGSLPHVQTYRLGISKKFLRDPLASILIQEFKPLEPV